MAQLTQFLPFTPATILGWLTRFGAQHRLVPGWSGWRVTRAEARAKVGQRRGYRWGFSGWGSLGVETRLTDLDYPNSLTTEGTSRQGGQYRHHRVADATTDGSLLTDEVHLRLPGGLLTNTLAAPWVRRRLQRTLHWQQARVKAELTHLAAYAHLPRLKIGVTGSSGAIGQELVPFLNAAGHEVWRLVRRQPLPNTREILWDPLGDRVDTEKLADLDVVIHLAGENLGKARWSTAFKQHLLANRTLLSEHLAATLAGLKRGPKTLIVASAIGYYGDQPGALLTETTPPGHNFASRLCQALEQATSPAADAGLRVVFARLGVVLQAQGTLLRQLHWPFWLGLGAKLGHGRQHFSWVAIDDVLYALHHIIHTPSLVGAVNVTSPLPVPQATFADTLAGVYRRPRWGTLPRWLLRLQFGPMADDLLLADTAVVPDRLRQTGFSFTYPTLAQALAWTVGRPW